MVILTVHEEKDLRDVACKHVISSSLMYLKVSLYSSDIGVLCHTRGLIELSHSSLKSDTLQITNCNAVHAICIIYY